MEFRERGEHELDRLGDEELIAYVTGARDAQRFAEARRALGIFAHRRTENLVRRALLKVPTRQDAEDLAQQTIEAVLKASFEGAAVGEAVNFMNTILARKIADFTDRQRRTRTDPLPEELDDEERVRRAAAISPARTGTVDLEDAIERVLAKLSPAHRRVVEEYLAGAGAKETAATVNTEFPHLDPPMSDQNAHQIASRFRTDMKAELGELR